jgi:hypothetical protein
MLSSKSWLIAERIASHFVGNRADATACQESAPPSVPNTAEADKHGRAGRRKKAPPPICHHRIRKLKDGMVGKTVLQYH